MNFLKTKPSTEFDVYLTDGYGYFPSSLSDLAKPSSRSWPNSCYAV